MKVFIFSCLVLLIAFSSGLPTGDSGDNGSENNLIAPRIIDGTLTDKTYYYEVAIMSTDNTAVKLCSGALLSSKWVLTSAFCAKRRSVLRVFYGVNYIYPPPSATESIMVERAYCHPNYNPLTLDHDIALLELGAAITNANIMHVSLPSTQNYNYIGLTATVSGWGPAPDSMSSSALYCLEFKKTVVIENAFCTRENYAMSPYKLCTEDRAVCEGDQGAPLVIDNRIIGIAVAAHNANKCASAEVTPYTRVSSYLKWIQQITQTPCTVC